MPAPEQKNVFLELLKVCLTHNLLQNEKKVGKVLTLLIILIKNWCIKSHIFTYEFLLEPSLLELYHDRLSGLLRWEGGNQGPLIRVVNCFSLIKRGQTRFLSRSTALAVLAASRMNACGSLTNGCFYPPITTTSSWTPRDIGLPYPLGLLSLLYLTQLHIERDSKIFACGHNWLNNYQVNMFLEILQKLLYKASK